MFSISDLVGCYNPCVSPAVCVLNGCTVGIASKMGLSEGRFQYRVYFGDLVHFQKFTNILIAYYVFTLNSPAHSAACAVVSL